MKSFLQELAAEIYSSCRNSLDQVTLVFPNRRAALYFRKHLAELLDTPAFSPGLITIEDFIGEFSGLRVPEKLQLIHRLYKVYQQVVPESAGETFDQFYFWGEMLLKDFDEIDKYMVEASLLFRDLSHQKELDAEFDFLTDEQRDFLRSFWSHFDEKTSLNKKRFLETWQSLPKVYQSFKTALSAEGLAYEGMLHRVVATDVSTLNENTIYQKQKLVFAGFNALTRAEETIIAFFVEQKNASVHWDIDNYYYHNQVQEAGKFFREYSDHPVLGKTFPPDIPSNFIRLKRASLYAAAQPVGQAKMMAQVLAEKLQTGYMPEETLVVLPDEKLLTAVLHGIAGKVEKLNVTMGFPLTSTPTHNLIELLVELQQNRKDDFFSHHQVLALLGHPYIVAADPANAQAKRKEILQKNWVYIPQSFLATHVEVHRRLFSRPKKSAGQTYASAVTAYLKSVVVEIGALPGLSDIDREYCFHFLQILNRMEEVFSDHHEVEETPSESTRAVERAELKSFLHLFRQISRAEKIPFSGEPLRGLQVMGVLETRNLDFKNVFILSLNEGAFPSFSGGGSYVPYNIRQAYGMPTVEKQDAMYAYLFYRVLQRAENVHLFYNSETDDLGQGEMSRYLQQLVYESGISFEKHVLHNDLRPLSPGPLSVTKDERVFNALSQYCLGARDQKSLSPTALNDYLECRLKFYFKYVAKIREPYEVEEDLDARVLGNFLHRVMEFFYEGILERKGNNTIEESDFNDYESEIEKLIDRAFIDNYRLDPERRVVYEGQRLVVREIVRRFVDRIIDIDKRYTPFTIEAIERRDISLHVSVDKTVVVLGGSIDRADRKADVIRVIDYKTGKDLLSFQDIPSLFIRDKKRNKAAFQTFLYTLLFKQTIHEENVKLVPGLINRINVFNDDFRFGLIQGKTYLADATPLLPEFHEGVNELVTEIFNPEVAFDQTTQTEACKFCSYSHICYR